MYRVEVRPGALRDLRGLDRQIQSRVVIALRGLESDPSPPASMHLKGYPTLRRLRVGAHRIVYSIDDATVTVHRIKHRRDVYRRIDELL